MNYRSEIVRKAIHIGASVCPLVYLLIPRELMLALAIPVMVFFLLVDLLRQRYAPVRSLYDRWLGYMMRDHEQGRLCGASYVMIAVVVCVWLYPQRIAIAALLFMSISDALASLVGLRAGGPRWFGKSLAGSATFLASALIISWLCLTGRPLVGAAGAVVATLIEALPLRIGRFRLDDNLVVPVVSGAAMFALLAWL